MTECPTCKLSMESHSTEELMECCMKQVGDEGFQKNKKVHVLTVNTKLRIIRIKDWQNVQ